jgi:hypothetical protein
MNFKALFQSIAAAAIGGAITATADAAIDPSVLQNPERLGTVAAAGALVGVAALWKEKPKKTPKAPKKPKQ